MAKYLQVMVCAFARAVTLQFLRACPNALQVSRVWVSPDVSQSASCSSERHYYLQLIRHREEVLGQSSIY